MKYKFKRVEEHGYIITEEGHTMFPEDVIQRLDTINFLEGKKTAMCGANSNAVLGDVLRGVSEEDFMIKRLSDVELGEQIQNLSMFAGVMDLERLKEFRSEFESQIGTYTAIGIVDGHAYFDKLETMQARFRRLDALINFIEVSKDTEKSAQNCA